ncbi:MAG TPA: ATP-binding protein [Candidatus Binatia bacterium]|nr:ATP-binding protein [Candidatus Binatia bacterium]
MGDISSDPKALSRLVAELREAKRSVEQELARERDARALAEDANRRKDEFLAILSHDLRSPLNAVLTWIQVLRSEGVDAKTREQALASIERSAGLQTRMIEDLLDISRIISGKLSLEFQDADLAQIVRAALETILASAEEKGIEVELAIDHEPIPLCADPARLQQVVGNVLSNAIKFTPSGGNVTVELRRQEGEAEIRVVDSGEGISAEVLPYVFDRFRQGDSSITKRHGGLGLGLAIARHIVELHGGEIRAESEGEGRGATFRMRLPLDRGSGVSPEQSGAARAVQADPDLGGISVLVVDDDPDTCQALEIILRQAGAGVRTAGSVQEALRACSEAAIDVVVTDLAMPDLDGYALLDALRSADEAGKHVPIIALTAAATPEDRQRVRAAGFALHLTKPVEPLEMLKAVAMTITGRAGEFAQQRTRALLPATHP